MTHDGSVWSSQDCRGSGPEVVQGLKRYRFGLKRLEERLRALEKEIATTGAELAAKEAELKSSLQYREDRG